jgi:hypothetical protein
MTSVDISNGETVLCVPIRMINDKMR